MLSTTLRTTAALLATTASLSAVASLAADASATTRVAVKPSGNATLDDYCRQAADLINEALDESDRLDSHFPAESQAWYDHALDLVRRAQANGCSFSAALTARLATDQTVVTAVPTGNARMDARCRHWAVQINEAHRDGNPSYAASIQAGAEQKGCRFVVVRRVAVARPSGAATAIG